MSQAEQLHATQIRIARETTLGSGIASGAWYRPQMTAAAVQREIKLQAERRSPHRGMTSREIVAESWTMATSHEVGLPFLRMILATHMTSRGGGRYTLDPEAPNPTWVIETESEAGDTAKFSGAAVGEIRVAIDERKVVRVELKWQILRRTVLACPTAGTDGGNLAGPMIATTECGLSATTGTWGADPRVDDAAVFHGGQIYLTRKIAPANYGPDGIPEIFDRAPWEVVGEAFMPETPGLTDTAFSDIWTGAVAMWIGQGADSLWIQNASGFVTDEDLLAYDWRVRRVAFQGQADDRRSLIEFFT